MFWFQSIELFTGGTTHPDMWPLPLADDPIKVFLLSMSISSADIMHFSLRARSSKYMSVSFSECMSVSHSFTHAPAVFGLALPPVQCLSFLTVAKLIFYCSEICLANKPLTRQKEGVGHWLYMRDQ